ncbi:hypothetical protein [Flavobacterium laiguense]|uniref:DUF3575 domain-containing protein n=1 Tax=Flavobacterium laiguense TaxID=2169409 RepID=A0A2U1JVE9_9FLAO|nr:hypothetical protein [Flavobacterium laiguense]PWA08914.1 hypothetical protein DB891_09670 [Flavobacterium laiguense]
MKLFHSFVCFLLFCPLIKTTAQETTVVEKNQFKINLILPGVVYEHGFSAKNTLYSELSFGVGYRNSDFGGSNWSYYPTIDEQFRHYYNIEKRAGKGKRTLGNSGNFYGFNAIYRFESINSNSNYSSSTPSITVAPVWGFQRTYKHNLNLNLNGGVGYNFDKYGSQVVPVINFTIGWVIGK